MNNLLLVQLIYTFYYPFFPFINTKCNNKKRTITGEKIEQRFTHVYYDEFPDFPILVADVSFNNNTLIFDFKIDGSKIPELRFKQLSFQNHSWKMH